MTMPESLVGKQNLYGPLWWEEIERMEGEPRDWELIRSAELADELVVERLMTEQDPDFENERYQWNEYVLDRSLLLPLEQSCHEGVLLPTDMRAVRLATCPEELLSPLRWFFELCPIHVKAWIALECYLIVRSERGRRTGRADWSPERAMQEKLLQPSR